MARAMTSPSDASGLGRGPLAGGTNGRERILLALTIVGFVVPNTIVALYAARYGLLSFDGYFRGWGESLPAAQLALDVIIVFVAFALWAAWEGKRLKMRSWWVPIPASLLVGVCFAVPLFLLLRERAIQPENASGRASD